MAVEDDDVWLEDIVAWGYGLKGMYYLTPTSPITEVCISSDGALGFRNGHSNIFGVWNLWTGALLRTFEGHSGRVTCLHPSIDVSVVVSGSEDKTLRLWKPATVSDSEDETGLLWKPVTAECVRVLKGHEHVPSKVRLSLDATKILSADRGGMIKLWDVASGECLRTINAHGDNVTGLYFMFDGRFAVSSSWDKTIKVWDLTDGSCIRTFECGDWVTSVDMTPDGRYLLASSYEGIKVWELVWRLDTCEAAEWDERARPFLEILMNANAAWEGKLGTPVDMTDEEIRNTLRRGCPSWTAWHEPSKKEDWHRVWHLDWDVERTLGYAGYGWLSEVGLEGNAYMDEWKRKRRSHETQPEGD